MTTVGLISDTHGLIRPEALQAMRGVDWIVHAGDVGNTAVLAALEKIAPVHAVRGNVDRGAWADQLAESCVVEMGGGLLYVLHDLNQLDLDPVAAGFSVVVFGHSHRPSAVWKEGVLYVNPGSAGPPRFDLPVTLARLQFGPGPPQVEIIPLDRAD